MNRTDFLFASGAEVAGQWCCAQTRPTSHAATPSLQLVISQGLVGDRDLEPRDIYWTYVSLWGVLISKWQGTHQKVKSLVYSHRTGRGWVLRCVVVLSPGSTLNWRVGEEREVMVQPASLPTQSTFPMLVTLQIHEWTLTSQTNEFEEPISGVADSLLCRAWRNQSVYFCCLKQPYLTKSVLDLHNITCEKLNEHTSPRKWESILWMFLMFWFSVFTTYMKCMDL